MPTWLRWTLGFLVWTVLALVSASQLAVYLAIEGQPIEWARIIPDRLVNWYTCAIFTPIFFVVARRWPIDASSWSRHVPFHLALCAVASLIKFVAEREILVRALGRSDIARADMLQRGFISENIAFWCMAAAVHAIEFHRRVRERDVLSARLEARLSEAQLESLTARLHPHFLFNTLQAISTLVHRDSAAADTMLGHLSTMLRRMLRSRPRHEVPLAEELALVEEYLAIAQTRFGDRLTIRRDIAPDVVTGLVPYLVLQPLLENAFEHGIALKAGAGSVVIRALREADHLRITVADDGHGPRAAPAREGVGLGTTRARLAELYGGRAALTIAAGPTGGTVATLVLPFHTAPISVALERVA